MQNWLKNPEVGMFLQNDKKRIFQSDALEIERAIILNVWEWSLFRFLMHLMLVHKKYFLGKNTVDTISRWTSGFQSLISIDTIEYITV